MSRRYIIDANLPIALARALEALGHTSRHVSDIAAMSTPDIKIWDIAKASGEIIVSKDRDFADLVRVTPAGPAVVWLRVGNTRKSELIARMARDWPQIVTALDHGERLIEVR